MTENNRPLSEIDSALDATLRRALEPDQAAASRLVRSALTERRAPRPRLRRLVTATAVAVMAVIALLTLELRRPGAPPSGDPRREMPRQKVPARARITEPTPASAPATLRISNEDGPVIVTTSAGSKLVFLPLVFFDQPNPGDAS